LVFMQTSTIAPEVNSLDCIGFGNPTRSRRRLSMQSQFYNLLFLNVALFVYGLAYEENRKRDVLHQGSNVHGGTQAMIGTLIDSVVILCCLHYLLDYI